MLKNLYYWMKKPLKSAVPVAACNVFIYIVIFEAFCWVQASNDTFELHDIASLTL